MACETDMPNFGRLDCDSITAFRNKSRMFLTENFEFVSMEQQMALHSSYVGFVGLKFYCKRLMRLRFDKLK